MFFTYKTRTFLEYANKSVSKKIDPVVRFSTLSNLDRPWILHKIPNPDKEHKFHYTQTTTSDNCTECKKILSENNLWIDFPTPQFMNLRWIQYVEDYPDGELFALFFCGMIRSKRSIVILCGDWEGQTFDLTQCYNDKIPKHLKKYQYHESFYNRDSYLIQSMGAVIDSMTKNKMKLMPLPEENKDYIYHLSS
jgi:hypothetical protein